MACAAARGALARVAMLVARTAAGARAAPHATAALSRHNPAHRSTDYAQSRSRLGVRQRCRTGAAGDRRCCSGARARATAARCAGAASAAFTRHTLNACAGPICRVAPARRRALLVRVGSAVCARAAAACASAAACRRARRRSRLAPRATVRSECADAASRGGADAVHGRPRAARGLRHTDARPGILVRRLAAR